MAQPICKRSSARVPPVPFLLRNVRIGSNTSPQTSDALSRQRFSIDIEDPRVADGRNPGLLSLQQLRCDRMQRIPMIVADLVDLAAPVDAHVVKIDIRPSELTN